MYSAHSTWSATEQAALLLWPPEMRPSSSSVSPAGSDWWEQFAVRIKSEVSSVLKSDTIMGLTASLSIAAERTSCSSRMRLISTDSVSKRIER